MSTIPEKYQELAREIKELAKKYNLQSFSATFSPGWDHKSGALVKDWDGAINVQWDTGRHGEDMNDIHLSSTLNVWLKTK